MDSFWKCFIFMKNQFSLATLNQESPSWYGRVAQWIRPSDPNNVGSILSSFKDKYEQEEGRTTDHDTFFNILLV